MSTTSHLQFLVVMAATHGLYAESFLRELKRQGHRVIVVTRAEALSYDWPREAIDALYAVNDIFDQRELRHAVGYLARELRIDRLVGPGEYDIEIAAALREHFRLEGLSESQARYFRDKLAMRERAAKRGVPVPAGFLAGTESRELRQAGIGATRRIVGTHLRYVKGTHLFPMERPLETASAVRDMLAQLRGDHRRSLAA